MLGSAKINFPLLTLTTWVKVASRFEKNCNMIFRKWGGAGGQRPFAKEIQFWWHIARRSYYLNTLTLVHEILIKSSLNKVHLFQKILYRGQAHLSIFDWTTMIWKGKIGRCSLQVLKPLQNAKHNYAEDGKDEDWNGDTNRLEFFHFFQASWFRCWLIVWLVGWLAGQLVDWFDCLVRWLVVWPVGWLNGLVDWLVGFVLFGFVWFG